MTCHSALPVVVACPKQALTLCADKTLKKRVLDIEPCQIASRSICRRKSHKTLAKLRSRTSDSTTRSATTQPDQLHRADCEGAAFRRSKLKMEESLARSMLSDPDLEGEPLKLLRTMEAFWKAMKEQPAKRGQTVIHKKHRRMPSSAEFDVCVCGGTLGIFVATSLQERGYRVCIVERNNLQGRTQEWNISRHELESVVKKGLVTAAEIEAAIVTEFNPTRIGFKGSRDIWVNDVLNIGVSPRILIESMKQRFLRANGTLMEQTTFKSAQVFSDGVALSVSKKNDADAEEEEECHQRQPYQRSSAKASTSGRQATPRSLEEVHARLVVDCMGHWSPIVQQTRGAKKPDGICLVVGGCATGFPAEKNRTGDFLRTITDAEDDLQLFWEAFPAEGGSARTTYMFAYCDTDRQRPSIEAMLERYFQLLPSYQGIPLERLKFKRILFAGLPCYQDGPMQTKFDRIVQIGDASASASPLSFGGFGSMIRHLERLVDGLDEALSSNSLSVSKLQLLQPYQPSLSAAWLFQRSMSFKVGQLKQRRGRRGSVSGFLPPNHVNRLLACNFRVMYFLGDRALRPFLQDTIRWLPLTMAMNGMFFSDPILISKVLIQVGPKVLLSWFRHYWAMAAYSVVQFVAKPLQRVLKGYTFSRLVEAWRFGSGMDSPYSPPSKSQTMPA